MSLLLCGCVCVCVSMRVIFPFNSICSRSMSLLVLSGNRMFPVCTHWCVCECVNGRERNSVCVCVLRVCVLNFIVKYHAAGRVGHFLPSRNSNRGAENADIRACARARTYTHRHTQGVANADTRKHTHTHTHTHTHQCRARTRCSPHSTGPARSCRVSPE